MAMELSSIPTAPCTRASGSTTSNTARGVNPGALTKSSTLACSSTAKSRAAAASNSKEATMRVTSLTDSSTAMASITSRIPANSTKAISKLTTWTAKVS
jgi:hypothetical protein